MNDSFIELVVRKRPTTLDLLKKPVMISLTVFVGLIGLLINPLALIGLIIMVLLDYFFFPKFKVEYEYSYVNGEIDIAAIYSKESRKDLCQITMSDIECIALQGSHSLDAYGDTFKTVDYSANNPELVPYVIVKGGEQKQKILVQLNDAMLDDLRLRLPRKVHKD